MNSHHPWHQEAPDSAAAHEVALTAQVPPRPLDLATWGAVLRRAARPPSAWARVPAFFGAAAVGALLMLGALRLGALAPASAPLVVATDGTRWTTRGDGSLFLTAGRLTVDRAAAGRLRLGTPHFELEAVSERTRFLAEVSERGTLLVVDVGEVVARRPGLERVVAAGASFTWPPDPNIPQALLAPPRSAEPPRCGDGDAEARSACLRREAAGEGLDAQAALFELGTWEARAGRSGAAIDAWRASLRRFPGGVLHPEVRLSLLVELVRARRFAEALGLARDFEAACADDPRAGDVATLRKQLVESLAP
jgi:hypothetical protein